MFADCGGRRRWIPEPGGTDSEPGRTVVKGLEGGWFFDRLITVKDWLPASGDGLRFPLAQDVPLDGVNLLRYVRDGLGFGHLFRGEWKYVTQNGEFLFRIFDDPSEERSKAAEFPAIAGEMRASLRTQPVGQADRL
ncbi:MAG: hypothetical protein FJW30_10030 [Acidobacteria bacterium]|nr:hypothetical protein [Acidobacteriota bacterium]